MIAKVGKWTVSISRVTNEGAMNPAQAANFGFVLINDPSPDFAATGTGIPVVASGTITVGAQVPPSVQIQSSVLPFTIQSLTGVFNNGQGMSLGPVPPSSVGNLLSTKTPANGGIIPTPIPFYAPLYFNAAGTSYKIFQQDLPAPGVGEVLVDLSNPATTAAVKIFVFPLDLPAAPAPPTNLRIS